MEVFCAALAAVLPEMVYSYYFIVLYNRLLLLLTKATAATAFNDDATAKTTLCEHKALDSHVQTAINDFTSEGGVCYVVRESGRVLVHSVPSSLMKPSDAAAARMIAAIASTAGDSALAATTPAARIRASRASNQICGE